ncbi:MAG: stalk domain-containing protein [Defluviitaleaceae bacterium]|nr:stalk domain-containing protein [Defluviitaleaceae bacterium]
MRKTRIFTAILVVMFLLIVLVSSVTAIESADNSGGKFLAPIEPPTADSIPVSNRAELEAIRNNLTGAYHLTADIDLIGKEWIPIGDESTPFSGLFDGQGYAVKNMSIHAASGSVGLFGFVRSTTIKNVGIENGEISISNESGSLRVGGIVGATDSTRTSIINTYFMGTIRVTNADSTRITNVGGIAGGTTAASIEHSYNNADIFASSTAGVFVGGISGASSSSTNFTISNCYNSGNIHAESVSERSGAGGIVGSLSGGSGGRASLSDCYNLGTVTALSSSLRSISSGQGMPDVGAGGIIGVGSRADISNSYNAGDVTAKEVLSEAGQHRLGVRAGGIVGGYSGYDNQAPHVSNSVVLMARITEGDGGGNLLTLGEAMSKDTYVALGWDFENVWEMPKEGGYPVFKVLSVPQPTVSNPSVSNFTAQPTAQDVEVGVLIKWTAEDDAIGYFIYRSETEDEWEFIRKHGSTPTEFVDVNVNSHTRYIYEIVKMMPWQGDDEPIEDELIGTAEITTGEIRGAERDGEKGFIMMTIDSPIMSVNGEETEIDPGRGTTPQIIDGRTLMPIRAVIEAMNGSVDWNPAESKVSLFCGGHNVEMQLGNSSFTVGGAEKELDVPPQIINERTMMPIRFVAENIGCEIAWVGSTRQVIVVYWI